MESRLNIPAPALAQQKRDVDAEEGWRLKEPVPAQHFQWIEYGWWIAESRDSAIRNSINQLKVLGWGRGGYGRTGSTRSVHREKLFCVSKVARTANRHRWVGRIYPGA